MATSSRRTATAKSSCRHKIDIELVEDLPENECPKTHYPGVYFEKEQRRWRAQVYHNYERKNLGMFNTAEEARIAVLEWKVDNPPLDRGVWTQAARPYGNVPYKGVTFEKRGGRKKKYKAEMTHDGKRIYLGYHLTPEEAARAYDKKALELYGPTARLNFPNDPR